MLVTIFVVTLILFWDHVVISLEGWWKQLFTMTLLFTSQNSTSSNPLSFLLPLEHWPMQFSDPLLFLIFVLKSPAIVVLDIDILSISFFFGITCSGHYAFSVSHHGITLVFLRLVHKHWRCWYVLLWVHFFQLQFLIANFSTVYFPLLVLFCISLIGLLW